MSEEYHCGDHDQHDAHGAVEGWMSSTRFYVCPGTPLAPVARFYEVNGHRVFGVPERTTE